MYRDLTLEKARKELQNVPDLNTRKALEEFLERLAGPLSGTFSGSVSAASAVIGGKEISSQSGESTFAGQTGQTISITPVASANYHVEITPLAESGFIGEVWISTRTTNAFVVKNSGSDVSTAFAWQISGAALA